MQILRIEEAIARCKAAGRPVAKKELGALLWPERAEATQMVNMTNLLCGKTRRIAPEWVPVLCSALNCSADFLFGLSND